MRACLSLLVALVLASVGSQPLVAFSQPQTTTGGSPPCGCPQIPAVATSDKPDAGKIPFEVGFSDLEQTFSTREALYGGDWDKALVALAHELDPAGTLKIWTVPAPTPTNHSARVQEGSLTRYLFQGPPPPGHRHTKADYIVSFQQLIEIIARSNKYGEPTFGLRKAALRIARFEVGDLANALRSVDYAAIRGTATGRIVGTAQQAEFTLVSFLQNAWAVALGGPHAASMEAGRVKFARDHRALLLDNFDLANAALDVLLSVNDKGKREGVFGFYLPYSSPVHSGRNYSAEMTQALTDLAATRSVFGGPAKPGSPADAVACKAFAVLVTLADLRGEDGAKFRRYLFDETLMASVGGERSGYTAGGPHLGPQTLKAARAALIYVGFAGTDPTADWAGKLADGVNVQLRYFHAEIPTRDASSEGYIRHGPATISRLYTTMRDIEAFGKGPGKGAFVAVVDRSVTEQQASVQQGVDHDANWDSHPAWKPRQYWFGPKEDSGRKAAEWFLTAWQNTTTDYNPVDVEPFCPPAAATPRVIIFAKGVNGRIMIKKLYVGVPTTLGLMFPEPYDGESYPVKIQSGGGELSLTARPVDGRRLLFETEEFVVPRK